MSVAVEGVVAPDLSPGMMVDVKRDGHLRARITELGGAWHLRVLGPVWTNNCTDVVEAYDDYVNTCRMAGVRTDTDDVLTVVEIYRPVAAVEHGRDGRHRTSREMMAQVVQQEDDTWQLNVFAPRWNRPCRSVGEALRAFMDSAQPHPERGPVGGR